MPSVAYKRSIRLVGRGTRRARAATPTETSHGSKAVSSRPPRSVLTSIMFEGTRVAVVVPAFDEEFLIAKTIGGIPAFVDHIVVVDDCSRDATMAVARATADPRLEVVEHEENGGVGAAIVTGYQRCRELGIDVTCVMAADNQMDPDELENLVQPVALGEVEYAKANRLFSGEAWTLDPPCALSRECRAFAPHQDRVWLLACRRLASGVHGGLARRAAPTRPRPPVQRDTGSRTTCSSI